MSDAINSVQTRYARVVATMPTVKERIARSGGIRRSTANPHSALSQAEGQNRGGLRRLAEGHSRRAGPGIVLGEQVAAAVQADRAGDGTDEPDTYRPSASPGVYVTTAPPLLSAIRARKALGHPKGRPFPAWPAPQLSSAEWVRDCDEVKTLGGRSACARV